MRLLAALALLLAAAAAEASTPKEEAAFLSACVRAFEVSTPSGQESVGVPLCRCTVKEQKLAHVTSQALIAETQAIQADPKHQFKDRKLLDSLHYCAISMATGRKD